MPLNCNCWPPASAPNAAKPFVPSTRHWRRVTPATSPRLSPGSPTDAPPCHSWSTQMLAPQPPSNWRGKKRLNWPALRWNTPPKNDDFGNRLWEACRPGIVQLAKTSDSACAVNASALPSNCRRCGHCQCSTKSVCAQRHGCVGGLRQHIDLGTSGWPPYFGLHLIRCRRDSCIGSKDPADAPWRYGRSQIDADLAGLPRALATERLNA